MTSPAPDHNNLSDALFVAGLPERECASCHVIVPRRKHRVTLRFSWRGAPETLCPECWSIIMGLAKQAVMLSFGLAPWTEEPN